MNRYFEHKNDSYSNNKRKLYVLEGCLFKPLLPRKTKTSDGVLFEFITQDGKQIDEETLQKYFNEITLDIFNTKTVMDIPTNY
jgi:hypothetical protein